jgi:hypothetical protein
MSKAQPRWGKDTKETAERLNVPRVEDYLPKKDDIRPAYFPKGRGIPSGVKAYRRQRFSRNDPESQEL